MFGSAGKTMAAPPTRNPKRDCRLLTATMPSRRAPHRDQADAEQKRPAGGMTVRDPEQCRSVARSSSGQPAFVMVLGASEDY